jgi:hypothetical protein
MRLVGLCSILPPLATLALACAAPSPGSPEQAKDAVAPPAATEQASAAAAPSEPPAAEAEEEAAPAEARKDSAVLGPDAAPPAPAPARAPSPGDADRSQSRLDIAVPSINGGLNRDIIRRIASTHADDIRDCHGRALASMPELAGQLVVELWTNERGRVTNAELTGDTAVTDRVGQCVIELAMGWSFADAGGEGSFKLSLDFSGQ